MILFNPIVVKPKIPICCNYYLTTVKDLNGFPK